MVASRALEMTLPECKPVKLFFVDDSLVEIFGRCVSLPYLFFFFFFFFSLSLLQIFKFVCLVCDVKNLKYHRTTIVTSISVFRNGGGKKTIQIETENLHRYTKKK